jgi:hypothetical protein
MHKIIVTAIILILLSSCQKAFIYVVVGMRELKPETPKSIIGYGKRVKYDVENNFFQIDSSKVNQVWKGAFPKAYIYENNGDVVKHLDCFATMEHEVKLFFSKPIGSAQKVSDTLRQLLGQDIYLNIAPPLFQLEKDIHPLTIGSKLDLKKSK